ncbi:MAG TPA: hypothetical protein VNT20_16025 [Flavisolibacter sp.]|jgi:hypothetical protein|nr:hypothetical protein [Flavisolibacter sp.]
MEVSKIHLSSAEMELMQDAEIILTKNRILEKMKALLEEVQGKQIEFVKKKPLSAEVFKVSPKISKGENYLGLPYLILDYPRYSSENNFLFIRTMFWWGNFFSCTLHLAGGAKLEFADRIKSSHSQLQNCYISASEDQWVHQLEEPNYHKIHSMNKAQFDQCCDNFNHIKIASSHPLAEWEKAPFKLFENWKRYLSVCGLIP